MINKQIHDNYLYQIIDGQGGFCLALDGRLIVDKVELLLATHIQRNRGKIEDKQDTMTTEEYNFFQHINLKGEKVI